MRTLAIISIGLNVVLAAVVASQWRTEKKVAAADATPTVVPVQKTQSSFIARRSGGPKVETLVVSNLLESNFHWRSIEAEDYRAYIANLRAIGCPEDTIRDIIIADVDKLYARKLAPLRKPTEDFKFWKTGNSFSDYNNQSDEYYKAQREFAKEKRELLKQLLGVDYEKEISKQWGYPPAKDPLENLAPETRDRARGLTEKFSEQQSDIYRKARGHIDSTTQDELRSLRRQLHEDLAKIMGPDELLDYEVRTSDIARNMKYNELQAFDASEEEFRAIFKAKQAAEFLQRGEGKAEPDWQAQYKRERDELKQALGEDRYKEYERAKDGDYQNLMRLAEARGLESTVVDQVYQMRDEAQKAVSRVRSDQSLDADQRAAALAAIRAETEKTVVATLGEKNFKTYKRYAYWLRNIAPTTVGPR
jgi:hypothetical protein